MPQPSPSLASASTWTVTASPSNGSTTSSSGSTSTTFGASASGTSSGKVAPHESTQPVTGPSSQPTAQLPPPAAGSTGKFWQSKFGSQLPSWSWHGVMSTPELSSMKGTPCAMTAVLFGSVPHSISLPSASSTGCVDWMATMRHASPPSSVGTEMNDGPPESPGHVPTPPPPSDSWVGQPVVASVNGIELIGVTTSRLKNWLLLMLSRPKPTRTWSAPSTTWSISQP